MRLKPQLRLTSHLSRLSLLSPPVPLCSSVTFFCRGKNAEESRTRRNGPEGTRAKVHGERDYGPADVFGHVVRELLA